MVDAQTTEYLARLSRLEQFKLDDGNLDAARLGSRLNQRQELIDQLQNFDVSSLPADSRSDLNRRIAQIAQDTQSALDKLSRHFADLKAQKQQIVTARGAARGYRPDIRRASRTVNRKA